MRLITFAGGEGAHVGALVDDDRTIVDLTAAGVADDMNALIEAGESGLEAARKAIESGRHRSPAAGVTPLAPIPRPRRNVMCVGKNYHDHAAEFHNSGFDSTGKSAVPQFPVVFTKTPGSVIGPQVAINTGNDYSNSSDYEGELGVVLASGGRHISRADAYAHVYGYTIINDATARTIQRQHDQWLIGKSLDTYCPMGPVLVTADEIADVGAMRLTTRVNGETRQDAHVRDLIFDIPTLIATLSRTMTLEAADIIATGTPAGVGIGFDPPVYLKKGDRVDIEISGIGTLANPVE